MKVVDYITGNAIRIVYVDCGQKKRDLATFLEEIEKTRPNEHNQLVAHLDKVGEYGVTFNGYKENRLKGKHAQPICEFCSRRECRIFWFFDESDNRLIVITHGFIARGNHDHRSDIDRAQERRTLYYQYKRGIAGGFGRKELET